MIGAKIRSLRVEKGLTLTELAEKAGIAKSYLSNIERNLQNNPTFEYINKIARALDVEQERLLFEADSAGNSELQNDLMNFKKALAQMDDYQLEELMDYIEFTMWKRKQIN
ncbi:helix-turn-helix domain-containing protein [Fictibacillus phosphorivorans]|uniref:helix-turn-helix domain-containing protein n=1 Tax=Fictibacillus phosphorivorans TaxID=1221500 RepID=UPI0035E5FCEE